MTDPQHPIPKGREKPKRAKPVRKPKSERPASSYWSPHYGMDYNTIHGK